MAQGKNKKAAAQSRKSAARGRGRGRGAAAVSTDPSFVALTSPLQTVGLKYPDGNSTPSTTFIERTYVDLVSNSLGKWAVQIAAGRINDLYRLPTAVDAAGAISWDPFLNSANYTNIDAQTELYRVVKVAVKVKSIASATTNAGYIDTILTPGISFPTDFGDQGSYRDSRSLRDLDLVVMPPPMDGSARHYRLPGTTGAAADNDFGVVTLCLSGMPINTAAVRIEIQQHLEMLPKMGTVTAQMTSPAADRNGPLLSKTADYYAVAQPVFAAAAAGLGKYAVNQGLQYMYRNARYGAAPSA